MRRQRLLRASSAQTICIFCSTLVQPAYHASPIALRRCLNTHRPSQQSQATAQAPARADDGSNNVTAAGSSFSWSSDSTLTVAEQREKEFRRQQRLAAEAERERQRIAAFEQRQGEERARLADEQARRAAVDEARRKQSAEDEKKRIAARMAQLEAAEVARKKEEADRETGGIEVRKVQMEARAADEARRREMGRQRTAQRHSQDVFGASNQQLPQRQQQKPQQKAKSKPLSMPAFGDTANNAVAAAPESTWGSNADDITPIQYGDADEEPERLRPQLVDPPLMAQDFRPEREPRDRAVPQPRTERRERKKETFKGEKRLKLNGPQFGAQAKVGYDVPWTSGGSANAWDNLDLTDEQSSLHASKGGQHATSHRDQSYNDYGASASDSSRYSARDPNIRPDSRARSRYGDRPRQLPLQGEYETTPFDPSQFKPHFMDEEPQAGSWQHLSRRASDPPPPPLETDLSAMQQSQQSPGRDPFGDPEEIERNFRAHQQQRRVPSIRSSQRLERDGFAAQGRELDRSRMEQRKCARCLQYGHVAKDCMMKAVCRRCGEAGHRERNCPRAVSMKRLPLADREVATEAISNGTASTYRTTEAPENDLGPFGRSVSNGPIVRKTWASSTGLPGATDAGSTPARHQALSDRSPLETERPKQPELISAQASATPTDSLMQRRGLVGDEEKNADEGWFHPVHTPDVKQDLPVRMKTTRGDDVFSRESYESARGRERQSDYWQPPQQRRDDVFHREDYKNVRGREQPPQQRPQEYQFDTPNRAIEQEQEDLAASRRSRRSARGFDDDEEVEALPERRQRRQNRRSVEPQSVEMDEEAAMLREERLARKAERRAARLAALAEQRATVNLPEFISVQNLAQTLGVHYEAFVKQLGRLGYDDLFPGKVLNAETSGMIAMEYEFDPVFDEAGKDVDAERDLKAQPEVEDKSALPTRPPVVTIMGHVDHGKTTILDYLRKSAVAAGEAGGITQHIGAFSVPLSSVNGEEGGEKTITFLDTPGHAAFLSMRQRGANVTDIVVLVVAADDSVKPQTLESLRCAREAKVPVLVAINKIDKEGADVQRVKQDLAQHGVEIEDFGGDVQVVEVSGKTGQGIESLTEAIVTLGDVLDHRADTTGAVEGWVLEATTSKEAGRVATVLVKRGSLRSGDVLVAGTTWARVKTLKNERGEIVDSVLPGAPVEVDGWREQPSAGDQVLQALSGEHKAASVTEYRIEKAEREKMEADMQAINDARRAEQQKRAQTAKNSRFAGYGDVLEDLANPDSSTAAETSTTTEDEPTGQITVPFIIKADVSGSAEALAAYIPSLTNPLITPQILSSSVGAVNPSDIDLASAAGGHIIAFSLPPDENSKAAARKQGVRILENDVIYRVLDDVKEVLEEKLPEIVRQRVLGEAEVGASFEIGVGGRRKVKIAGCKVRNGVVGIRGRVRVLRGEGRVYDGIITSLKNVKKDVQEMRKGTECGVGFEDWEGFQVGDVVQCYEEVREKRKL